MFVIFGPGMTADDGRIAYQLIADSVRDNMARHQRGQELRPGWLQIVDLSDAFQPRHEERAESPKQPASQIGPRITQAASSTRRFFGDGLGDTIASVTKMFGITPCGGCERRRRLLNKLVRW